MNERHQRPMSEYTALRKSVHLRIKNLKDALWESGGMTKEAHDQLVEIEEWEERVHREVLEIYEAYTDTILEQAPLEQAHKEEQA